MGRAGTDHTCRVGGVGGVGRVLAVSGLAAWKALRDIVVFQVVQICRNGMVFEFVDERPAVGKNPLLRAVQNSTEAASSSSFNRIVTLRELSVRYASEAARDDGHRRLYSGHVRLYFRTTLPAGQPSYVRFLNAGVDDVLVIQDCSVTCQRAPIVHALWRVCGDRHAHERAISWIAPRRESAVASDCRHRTGV